MHQDGSIYKTVRNGGIISIIGKIFLFTYFFGYLKTV